MKKVMALITAVLFTSLMAARADDAKKADEVNLQGKIGCSACTYQVSDSCGVSLKTDDGKIYTLVKPSDDLMKARHGGGTLKVKGIVTEKDGKRFITASKVELEK